jgi:hypothetical protein
MDVLEMIKQLLVWMWTKTHLWINGQRKVIMRWYDQYGHEEIEPYTYSILE